MLSVIIPAHNESAFIGACLKAVLASNGDFLAKIIVVANGCDDDTIAIAQGFEKAFEGRGWAFRVLDLPAGGKLGALNAADEIVSGGRVYLDADVIVSEDLLSQIAQVLTRDTPVYCSGDLRISRPETWISRAYRRIYRKVPFMRYGVPGAGFFAMNSAGRARWGAWPDIISDDTFARLSFAPEERIKVAARYEWPIVEGWKNLVAVRRRQNIGVDEISRLYPELLANDDTPALGVGGVARLLVRDPLGFLVYGGVALVVKATKAKGGREWRRGR